MAKKQTSKRQTPSEPLLAADEAAELQLILDRLAVQNPDGESFSNWLRSLWKSLKGRENLVAALLQTLSRSPSDVGFRVFDAFQGLIQEKRFIKVLKQAGYRFAQRGYGVVSGEGSTERVVLVPTETRPSMAHMAVGPSSYLMLSVLISPVQASHSMGISAYFETSLSHLSAKVTATSVKQYRQFVQNASGLFAFPFCEIPLWHAAMLLKEMIELAARPHLAPDLREADQLLRSFHDPEREPYVYELMPPVNHSEVEMRTLDVEPLFEYIPLNFILFSKAEMAPLAQIIMDLDRSVLVVPQEIKMERAYTSTAKAIEALCVGERRVTLQRLLEETALWLKLSRQDDAAYTAWVIAQHIKKSTTSFGENAFLQQLAFLSLREHWPEDFRTREEAVEASQPYHETESGLILLK
jgi:hypothetical protein